MENNYTSTGEPGLQSFWCYVHAEDRSNIRVKRIIPNPSIFTGESSLNDLEHALLEKEQGNLNIWIIIPEIIWARMNGEAVNLAAQWLLNKGYSKVANRGWIYPIHRFANLGVE